MAATRILMDGFALTDIETLSILEKHTTDLATAGTYSTEDLEKDFSHSKEKLKPALQKMKELYLLFDSGTGRTGLVHDTLAPLVQQAYKNSGLPGQRSERIINNKIKEYIH